MCGHAINTKTTIKVERKMKEEITLGILAGGQAKRMQGLNKALVPFDGKPMISWIVEKLEKDVSTILISANDKADRLSKLGYRCVQDTVQGYAGPLAGLLALGESEYCQTPYLCMVPCDSPLIPRDMIQRMWHIMQTNPKVQIVRVVVGDRTQNTFLFVRRRIISSIRPFLEAGKRKVGHWVRQYCVENLVYDENSIYFSNFNTLEEIREFSLRNFKNTP